MIYDTRAERERAADRTEGCQVRIPEDPNSADTYHAPWKPRPDAHRLGRGHRVGRAELERGETAVVGRCTGKDWPLSSVGWMTQVDETGGADRTAEADIELRQRAVEVGAECAQHREPIEVRSRRHQEERRQCSGPADSLQVGEQERPPRPR